MRLRLLFLPALFIAFTLAAQTPVVTWTKKNGPLGGKILDIERDPGTNKIFLLDDNHRPYVSADNGNSWGELSFTGSDNYFNDIEITNGTIFLVASYNLYASTDGGVTFPERMTTVSPYSDARRLKRLPVSGDLVVLAYGAIYTSSNNGQSWTQTNATLGNADLRYLEVNSVDQIFILKPNASFEVRPFRSQNGGIAFTEQSTGIPSAQVQGLYGQGDGGKIYAITSGDIFSSTNGASWASIKSAAMTDAIICDYGDLQNSFVEVSADGLGMFFMDNVNHKLYSKTLTATDWELQASDFPSGTLSALCATAQDYPGATTATAYFGSQSGVFKTTTGGASVSEKNTGIAGVQGVQILSDNNNALYLRTASVGVLKSTDQGNSWTSVSNLATDLNYFFKSQDGTNLYAITTDNILHRSYDKGSSWYEASPLGGFAWAASADAEKVFGLQSLSSPLSLYYSDNSTNSWTASAVSVTGLPASFGIEQNNNQAKVWFASSTRMFLYLYDYNLGAYSYYRIDFTYDGNNAITSAVATQVTGVPIPDNDIYKVAAANGNLYLYQSYGVSADRIAVSADGATWTTRSVPVSDDFFVLSNGYILLSDNSDPDKLYLSRDDAATFEETSLPTSVNLYDLKDIALDNNGYAYLALNGDYLYQSINPIVLPSAPTNLEEVGHTATAVALRWVDPNTFDRDIIIERSLDGVNFSVVGQVSGWNGCYGSGIGNYVDSNLTPNTSYTYRVKAKSGAGQSAATSTVSFTTLSDCPQTLPDNSSWSAINVGGDGYDPLLSPVNVGIRRLGGGQYEINNLSLGLTGSNQSSTFFESCGATLVGDGSSTLDPNGMGSWDGTTLTLKWTTCYGGSETITLTLNAADPIPEKPAALYAYALNNSSIEIKWPSSYYEKSYVLERSSVSNASGFAEIATVPYPQTTFTDNGPLTIGTVYYYRLKSLNGNTVPDPSPYSDVVTVPLNKPNFIVAENAITDFKASATLGSIWADFNNDGLEDYFTMQFDDVNQLAYPMIFKNLGGGAYEPINIDVGSGTYLFPSVADYDNDHFPDIALNGDEARVLDIFRGNGDFTFTKVPSGELGDLAVIEKTLSTTSWTDVNNDGLLDILTANDEDGSFTLYTQNLNHSFTKKQQGEPSSDTPFVVLWADYDNDGFQDVLLGSTEGGGALYHNNGNGTLSQAVASGFDGAGFFTASWGDYNNDGNIDIFCGSVSKNALYKNNGDGTFTKDESTLISEQNYATGASWGDYNNDGYLDLMAMSLVFDPTSPSRLFLRDPSVTSSVVFKKITTEKITDPTVSHYSTANADPDQNGLLDIEASAFLFDDSGDRLSATNNSFYQNNNSPGNWVEVKLNPAAGKSTEAIGARISVTAGGQTQMREITAMSSLVSRNSTIAHFGLGAATGITNIQVRWPNGSIQNYPLPPVNQIVVIDEDVQGPAITSKTPAHASTGIEANTDITIVFDENSFPVNGKLITVRKTGQTDATATIDVTTGTKTGNQYVFTLPVALEGETEYSVLVDAGAFRDRYANPSAAIGPGDWRFTTKVVPDVTPPVISFTSPGNVAKGFSSVNPSITVTDNISVSTVVAHIRKISGSAYTDITAAPGAAANTYTVSLSEATHFDATGAEFYITATDLAGNSQRDPADAGTYKIYLTYDANQSAIPVSVLGIGGAVQNWKVIAIPFDLVSPNNGVSAIFNEFSTLTNKTDYRLITYGTPTAWSEYPDAFSTMSRGVGYFINVKADPGTIPLFDLQAPANSRSNLFQVNLKAGWNMIGNPYLTSISWDDVAALNGLSGAEAQLKTFSNGTYSNDQTLGPYEGGFVNITTAKTISIPFLGQTSSGGRRGVPSLGEDISAASWALPLVINQGELSYTLGGIGMAPDADASIDNYDDLTPPRFINFLEMNFPHPEHIAGNFTREIVPTQENYTWEFTVNSNMEGMAELNWNNAPLATSGKDLFLLDVSTQQLVNMKETGTFRFDPKESSTFRIYYGDNLNIAPERVQLGKAYPNPTSGSTSIPFSLPETGGISQSVSLQIMDAMGRPVFTVKEGQLNPGYYEAAFDAKELMNGFYTYRLSVKNRKGLITEVNKLIIK